MEGESFNLDSTALLVLSVAYFLPKVKKVLLLSGPSSFTTSSDA